MDIYPRTGQSDEKEEKTEDEQVIVSFLPYTMVWSKWCITPSVPLAKGIGLTVSFYLYRHDMDPLYWSSFRVDMVRIDPCLVFPILFGY